LKLNLGKYLEKANEEEISITKNGKTIAQLIGTRTFKYDLSELEQWVATMTAPHTLGEATVPAYGSGTAAEHGASGLAASHIADNATAVYNTDAAAGFGAAENELADSWLLTRNGEPVAQVIPILKQKKKRRIGFMSGPPDSKETIAALFESDWTDEDEERWLNETW
jgi:prevent-host-death family protein